MLALSDFNGFARDPSVIFYDLLEPSAGATRPSIVMLHGGGHTGACWLRTVNDRPGWAYLFAAAGHRVIAPDWPGHGRSGAVDYSKLDGGQVCHWLTSFIEQLGEPVVLVAHSMGGALGWRIAELAGRSVIAIVGVAPAPPGNIQPEANLLKETEQGWTVRVGSHTVFLQKAPSAPHESFIRNKLIGKSTRFPVESLARYASSLTITAPRLIYERLNIDGSQVRVEDPFSFAGRPVLVLTGTNDVDHPRRVDEAIAEWLKAHGAQAEFIWLGDRGISGNGHMLMLEDNSDDIGALILEWLEKSVK